MGTEGGNENVCYEHIKKIQFPLDIVETIAITMHNGRNIYIDNRFNSLEY